ncbi:MAG: LptF/LptG family permease, partial [Endomicrobiia bacterium]
FLPETKTLFNITIDTLNNEHILTEQIKAEKMVFSEGQWKLYNAIKRKFDSTGKELLSEKKYKTLQLNLSRKPEDFIPTVKETDMMTITELKKEIEKLKRNGEPLEKELVAYHMRFSYPFSSIIVLFIGIPFALGLSGKYVKIRGIGYVLVISFLYWSLFSIGRVLAETGILSAFLGAWFGNIIFLVIGVILFRNLMR